MGPTVAYCAAILAVAAEPSLTTQTGPAAATYAAELATEVVVNAKTSATKAATRATEVVAATTRVATLALAVVKESETSPTG